MIRFELPYTMRSTSLYLPEQASAQHLVGSPPIALFRSLIVFQGSQLSAEQEGFGEHM